MTAGTVLDRAAAHGLVEERFRTRRQTCTACDLPLAAHSLDQARACFTELEKKNPPYCRLTGPADVKTFMRASQRR